MQHFINGQAGLRFKVDKGFEEKSRDRKYNSYAVSRRKPARTGIKKDDYKNVREIRMEK